MHSRPYRYCIESSRRVSVGDCGLFEAYLLLVPLSALGLSGVTEGLFWAFLIILLSRAMICASAAVTVSVSKSTSIVFAPSLLYGFA